MTAPSDRPAASIDPARAALLVCVLGAGLRLAEWGAARSLWLDEAMLGLNIVGRPFARLLAPLANSQSAPWLFLWAERAAMVAFGPGERSLRLVALLAGIVLPWVVWRLGRAMFDAWTGVAAATLVALSPLMLYYANELKPYGSDALVAAGLLLTATRLRERATRASAWLALIAFGVVALWASFPALFVLGAVWTALVVDREIRGAPHARAWLTGAALAWGAAFALPYLTVMRHAAHDDFLQSFFANRFIVPWANGALATTMRSWTELALESFGGRFALAWPTPARGVLALVVALMCAIGVREAARRAGARALVLILGPIVLALAASAVRRYPVSPRLWAFATPLWAMLVALAVTALARRVRDARVGWRALGGATALAAASLALLSLADDVDAIRRPYARREQLGPLISALREEQARTREPVYVANRAAPHWLFYTTDWRGAQLPPIGGDDAERWLAARTCASASPSGCQLLGHRSSAHYIEGVGFAGRADEAWATAEVERLRAAASPRGWVLLYLSYPGEPAALAAAVERAHGTVERQVSDRASGDGRAAARAFRVCFAAS